MKRANAIVILMVCAVVLSGCTKKAPPQPQAKAPAPESPSVASDKANATGTPTNDAPALARKPVAVKPTKIGDSAWPLDGLTFVKGGPVQIEPGKVYIVEFWATWCPPCRTTIPHLTEVAHKYKNKNLVVVGISQEGIEKVKPFVAEWAEKMDYNVAVDATGSIGDGYMGAFGVNTIPHAFVVDSQGKIAWHGHPLDNMEQALDQAVAK